MKNINIKQITLTATTIFFLNACGGGGSSGGGTTLPEDTMVPQCDTMISVNGKTIQKVEEGAEVRIKHSKDGTKEACMIKGEAKLVNN